MKTGKHKITAITRADSTAQVPEGVAVKKVDYDDHSSLVEALRGQEVLIITMSVTAPRDQEAKLVEAAAAADVPWILPNEYGSDPANESLAKEILIGEQRAQTRALIDKLGKSAWISFVCSFWYEYSLSASPASYGFDFAERKVTLYDDGRTKINTTTWEQCGRAMASLLSLKVLRDDEHDRSPATLSQFKNTFLYVSSFLLSQRDMFESVLRVTGTSEADWTVTHEDVRERYAKGMEEMKAGNSNSRLGFVKVLYSRVFFPDGSGNYEASRGLHNDALGLPKEDLDERTKYAVELAAQGGPWALRR